MNKFPLFLFLSACVLLVIVIGLSLFDVYHEPDITFSLTWFGIIVAACSFPFIPKD